MIDIKILEGHDRIQVSDWARPLQLESSEFSDLYFFQAQYSGLPMNHVKWVRVGHILGSTWIGKTVNELNKAMVTQYEFVRGNIPVTHQLDMSEYNSIIDLQR